MKRSWLGLSLLALAGSPAIASYELLLIPETTTGRVHRIDPVTGANFGSFGGTDLAPVQVAASRSQGTAWVNGSFLGSFDYSTGARVGVTGSVSAATLFHDPAQNHLYTLAFGTLTRRTTDGAVLTSFTATISGSPYAWSASLLPGNRAIVFGSTNGNIAARTFSLSDGATISTSQGSLAVTQATLNVGQSFAINRGANTYVFYTVRDADGLWRLGRTTVNVNGAIQLHTSSALSGFAVGTYGLGLAPSHNGFYIVGPDVIAGTRVREFLVTDQGSSLALNSYQLSGITYAANSYVNVATVLAPEPASLAALGLGALTLLRRRRTAG